MFTTFDENNASQFVEGSGNGNHSDLNDIMSNQLFKLSNVPEIQ